jgi:hypothetical protein
VNWEEAQEAGFSLKDIEKNPERGARFTDLPPAAAKARNYTSWSRDFSTWVYGFQKLDLLRSPSTGKVSKAGEDERDFRMRLQLVMREQRDDAVDALKKKFATKIASLQEKIRKAQLVVEREADQASQAKMQTAISFGATLLGAVLGRKSGIKSTVGKATTAARGIGRSAQQQSDVARAKETVETYQQQLEDLNSEFEAEAEALANKIDPTTEELETVTIRPKKTDISVQLVALVWVPYRDGEPAW